MKNISTISFSGGGWNYVFHAGATMRLLRENLFSKDLRTHGASAGALISFALLNHLDEILNFGDAIAISANILDKVSYFNPLPMQTNFGQLAEEFVDVWLSFDTEAYKRMNNRLHVSVSEFPKRGRIINEFNSQNELKRALMTSCYVPYVMNRPKEVYGSPLAYDGSFTNDIWRFDENTVTVGIHKFGINDPGFNFDIQPNYHLNLLTSFIPWPGHTKAGLFGHGYEVANKWINNIKN